MFYNKGEICYAASRMLVEKPIYEEFIARIKKRAESTVVGDPLDPKSQMGPIANKREYDNVLRYMEVGKGDGARLVSGGAKAEVPGGKGYFVQPTIFADVTEEMTIFKEETFGPILSVTPFSGIEEGIRIANGNQYGLVSGVFTTDMKKAIRTSEELQSGVVWVNTWGEFDVSAAFGGYKMSGYARERGPKRSRNICRSKPSGSTTNKTGSFFPLCLSRAEREEQSEKETMKILAIFRLKEGVTRASLKDIFEAEEHQAGRSTSRASWSKCICLSGFQGRFSF